MMSASGERASATTATTSNPFLPMGGPYRGAIIAYLILYHLIFPAFAVGDSAGPLIAFRLLSEALFVGLSVLPFIMLRQEGGWLHPLMLPVVLNLAKEVFKNPIALINPIGSPMVYLGAKTLSPATSLRLSDMELDLTRIGLTLTACLALVVYYAAYFGSRHFRWPKLPVAYGRNVAAVSLTVIAVSTVTAMILFEMSGGLSRYLVAMRGGRVALFANIGPVLDVITFSSTALLIWFAYERRPFVNPWFIGSLIVSLGLTLAATGSRSETVGPAVMLLLLWWRKTGRVRLAPIVILVVFAYAVLGGFGAIRQNYGSNSVDWSVIQSGDVSEWFNSATTETQKRDNEEADLAVFAGANQYGLLWGRTYSYSVSFWIPRGIWPDKPRSADAYNMWVNFAGHGIDEALPRAGEGAFWGIPVGRVAEAYWNFHLIGVVIVSLLMGMYARSLTALAQQYAWIPAVIPIVAMMSQFAGTSKTFVALLRDIAFLVPLLWAMGVLVLGPRGVVRRGRGASNRAVSASSGMARE